MAELTPTTGTAGLQTQLPGQAATISNAAAATGGIAPGNLIETAIDEELYRFHSDDTPLMQIALKAKKIKVNSPEIQHFQLDEPRAWVKTDKALAAATTATSVLPLNLADAALVRPCTTLLVKGVKGYTADGSKVDPGSELMLFCTATDASTGMPVVRAVNGIKANSADEFCKCPAIPVDSTVVILSNALHETQKEVDPDLILPQAQTLYLQKRGMNQIVSDYFDSVKKRIPFQKAIIAEQAIANFKVKSNRSFWAGKKSKFTVDVPKMGRQFVYTSEGLRWQFKKELQHSGKWTVEAIIALAKMYFTGEDVPNSALLLAGKNLLEAIQCIDYSKHPEIQITTVTNTTGWKVTNFHTVFGDIEIKHEPTLDRLGWSNSGALISPDRVVRYVFSEEHSATDKVEGQEATRESLVVWDAIALKGTCHIWIDGENAAANEGATGFTMWASPEAPAKPGDLVYYLLEDCPGISAKAVSGTMWQHNGTAWKEFTGNIAV